MGVLYCTGMSHPSQVTLDSEKIVVGDENGVVRVFDSEKFQVKRILFGLTGKVILLKVIDYLLRVDLSNH